MEPEGSDWNKALQNQERMIGALERFQSANQERFMDTLEKIATRENQDATNKSLERIHEDLQEVIHSLNLAVDKLSGPMANLMKVPIAIVVVGVASWGFFYQQQIGERTWLILLVVAVFPWLGESVTAIARIIRGDKNGDAKK